MMLVEVVTVFFKSVSHQLYGTAHLRFEILMSGIAHLNNHPEFYVESISNNTWANYVQQMSNPGTWQHGKLTTQNCRQTRKVA